MRKIVNTQREYEFRVAGVVPESVLIEIEDVRVLVEPIQTNLRVAGVDQTELLDILHRLIREGFNPIEVRRRPDGLGNKPPSQDPSR
jgi:hypothetical protein